MHLTLQMTDLMLQATDLDPFAGGFFPFPFCCFDFLLGRPA
jgi:hypothetical protein